MGKHIGRIPRPAKDRFMDKVSVIGDCWIWTGTKRATGYGMFAMSPGKTWSAHRASYHLFVGEITDGMCVLHICDNRSCVNPDHLYLGTQGENVKDMIDKGRQGNTGENHPDAKLTWEKVEYIRSSDRGNKSLADELGVSATVISHVKSGKTWKTKLDKPEINKFEDVPRWDEKSTHEIDEINRIEFESHVDKYLDCWVWTGSTMSSKGDITPIIRLRDYRYRVIREIAYRFSYRAFIGEIPSGYVVRHKCDNRMCVNPDHLEVGTYQDNVNDMISRGRAWFQNTRR